MKNFIFVLITFFTLHLTSSAQVGIGQIPMSGSILDLTNSSNKYLILPVANVDPSAILTDSSAVIYYEGNIYMKTSGGMKVFTPWQWDGDSTHSISSPVSASVGIGIVPSASNYRLQVADAGEITTNSNSPASFVVGEVNSNPSCPHLMLDKNEILAKSNATNAGTLQLQEEGGFVNIRSASSDAGVGTVITAFGSMDAKGKIKENGNDLMPVGAIIMWSGTTPPAGWALCDGNSYTGMDGTSTIVTPNLKERFIVGLGNDPAVPGGPYNTTGPGVDGVVAVTLSENHIPSHNHGGNTLNDTHDHSFTFSQTGGFFDTDGAGGDDCSITLGDATTSGFGSFGDFESDMETALQSNTHSHGISNYGLGQAHENRPPYYVLAFIMKL